MSEQTSDNQALAAFNANVVDEFRANSGKVFGQFEGSDLLLLTTIGAKSGQRRVNPLQYLRIDGKIIVVGAYAGAVIDPARQPARASRTRNAGVRGDRSRAVIRRATARVVSNHRSRTRFHHISIADQPALPVVRIDITHERFIRRSNDKFSTAAKVAPGGYSCDRRRDFPQHRCAQCGLHHWCGQIRSPRTDHNPDHTSGGAGHPVCDAAADRPPLWRLVLVVQLQRRTAVNPCSQP
jgi:F420H(2)-dependent quinone reductase